MLKGFMRLAACTASGAAFLALTGCGGAAPDDGYAGPPPSSYDRGASTPTLMGQGAAARPAPDGLAGGPRTFSGMAPVPNPGDLSKADRVRFYGHKYDYLPEPKGQTAAASTGGPRFQLVTRRKADGTLQIAMRPVANPEDMTAAERRQVYGNRYAPRAVAAAPRRSWRAATSTPAPVVKPVVKPAVIKAAPPAPVKPAPAPVAAAPLKPAAPAPVLSPAAPVAAAPKLTPPQQLQAAVSGGINSGATLSVPADLKAGKEADVVLSLPGDLLAMVQEQAAKLGLGRAARKVDAYASLKGDGYAINPPGQQTAPVAVGKPTTFTWKVKPTDAVRSPLTADYGLELKGVKPKTAFSVGSLKEAVAAPVEAATTAAKGFKLPKLGMPSLKALAFPWVPEPTLPGVGKVARENVVGGALALLALILLVVLARGAGASRARAERRRKFRTMQDYGVNEQEPAHEAHPVTAASQGYVNPMVAAAAGAAGGYALASHGHDDHGHGDHGHGHDDHGHGHDDHGHGHDDHGHGHDDHGHGHGDHGHGAHHTSHDAHGHDDHGHGHGHDDHGHKADDHGHGHDDHGHGHGHDDHGHGAHHAASTSHGHDDHGHGHDDHGHKADDHGHGHDDGHGHGDGHGHDDHGHGHGHDGHHTALTSHGHDDHAGHDGHGHGHDDHGHDHGHGPAQHISHTGHDDHGHGHDDHGHKADDHGHGHDDHAHGHGHDEHHKEPEHAH